MLSRVAKQADCGGARPVSNQCEEDQVEAMTSIIENASFLNGEASNMAW